MDQKRVASAALFYLDNGSNGVKMMKTMSNWYDDDSMEICGVEFTSHEDYEAIKIGIGSSMIEGFVPDEDSVRRIKDVFEGKMTIAELAELYKSKDKEC